MYLSKDQSVTHYTNRTNGDCHFGNDDDTYGTSIVSRSRKLEIEYYLGSEVYCLRGKNKYRYDVQ